MTNLTEYKPKLVIQFYDKTVAYIDAEHKDAFMRSIKENRFVEIDGVTWNTREIKFVKDQKSVNKDRTKHLGKVWQPPQ